MTPVFGALDLGGTKLWLALVDQSAKIVWQLCKNIGMVAFDKEKLLELLEQLLLDAPKNYAVQNFSFALLCIVNPTGQALTKTSNITADLQVCEIRELVFAALA